MIDRFGKQIVSPLDQLQGVDMKTCDLCRDIESQPVARLFFGPRGAEDKTVITASRLYAIGIDACGKCSQKISRAVALEIHAINQSVLPESFAVWPSLTQELPN